jgi:hypothetical protein
MPAGHFQFELSLVEYTCDDEGEHTDALASLPANLKVGVALCDARPTYQAIGSTGVTHAYSDDWISDADLTFGISNSADDFSPFVRTSFRF